MKRTERNKYFQFLKRLRTNGRSNMYGAIPYLMRAFALDREAAFRIVCEWLDAQAAAQVPVPAATEPGRPVRRRRGAARRAA